MCFRAILLSICILADAIAFPKLPERALAPMLQSANYDPSNLDSVIAAAHDPSYVTRMLACELLAYRPGLKSTEVLKAALQDSELPVRVSAARALLVLGDRTGIAQLRKDWGALIPEETERDSSSRGEMNAYTLSLALDVGLVLTESGEGRALPLAEFAALNDSLAANRSVAVQVLAAGLALDEAELREWGVDPVAVLRRISATEKQSTVLGKIGPLLEKTPPDKAIPILNALADSRHISGALKYAVDALLKRKEAEIRREAPASQPAHGVQIPVDNHPRTQPQPG